MRKRTPPPPPVSRADVFAQTIYPRLTEIAQWVRDGAMDKDVADKLGINVSTFQGYKAAFPVLREIIEASGAIANQRVENALFARALGMPSIETEERPQVSEDAEGNKVLSAPVLVKRVTKRLAPDVVACIFWLKNRDPKRWRDVTESKVEEVLNDASLANAKSKLHKLLVREMRKANPTAYSTPAVIETVPGVAVEGSKG